MVCERAEKFVQDPSSSTGGFVRNLTNIAGGFDVLCPVPDRFWR